MTTPLTTDIIDKPKLWRLYLEVTNDALEMVVYSTFHDQSLIHRRLPFDIAASSREQALGSIIYDNELLLADFAHVNILIDSPRFMIVPAAVSEDTAMSMATSMWGEDFMLLTDRLPVTGVKLITAADKATAVFLRRTYPTVTPRNPISQLITYFYNKDCLNNSSKMYAHLRHDGRLDIIHFDNQKLRIANTFVTANVDDMVYYTLLATQNTGFDLRNDDFMICGTSPLRDNFQAMIRKYATYVMPVVFPSQMYHAGKAALESPFELIVTPLCE